MSCSIVRLHVSVVYVWQDCSFNGLIPKLRMINDSIIPKGFNPIGYPDRAG